MMLQLSRSLSQFETQDIKTQPQFNIRSKRQLAESWFHAYQKKNCSGTKGQRKVNRCLSSSSWLSQLLSFIFTLNSLSLPSSLLIQNIIENQKSKSQKRQGRLKPLRATLLSFLIQFVISFSSSDSLGHRLEEYGRRMDSTTHWHLPFLSSFNLNHK